MHADKDGCSALISPVASPRKDEWANHPSFLGYIQVSRNGQVRSLDRLSDAGRRLKGKIICQSTEKDGHKRVGLTRPHGKSASFHFVHNLMLEAFVGPRPTPAHEGRHINGIPDDNRIENLAWGTRREQRLDDLRNGVNAQRKITHCPRGHKYTDFNNSKCSVKYHLGNGTGNRTCRSCGNARAYARRNGLDFDPQIADQYYRRHEEEWKCKHQS